MEKHLFKECYLGVVDYLLEKRRHAARRFPHRGETESEFVEYFNGAHLSQDAIHALHRA